MTDHSTFYASITSEQFDEALEELVGDLLASEILIIPGIYEVLSEEFNNEVLFNLARAAGLEDDNDEA